MKLERGQELYSEYLEGTLSPAMRLALDQHFQADPAALADYDDFARATALLNAMPSEDVEVPLGFRAGVMARVAASQSGRQGRGFGAWIAEWFGQPNRRELTGAMAGVAVIAVVAVTVLHPGTPVTTPVHTGAFGASQPPVVESTIQAVTTEDGPDGNLYHNFAVHLPTTVPAANVTAYVITSTDQILDPEARSEEATPALEAPIHLTNEENMTIPVGLLKQAPAGSTLDMLVQWKPDDPTKQAGSEVVFTPTDPNGAPDPTKAASQDGNFFDSLESIAAAYHVTVIADSSVAPTTSAAAWTAGETVDQALSAVSASEGWKMTKLNDGLYFVSH